VLLDHDDDDDDDEHDNDVCRQVYVVSERRLSGGQRLKVKGYRAMDRGESGDDDAGARSSFRWPSKPANPAYVDNRQ